MIKLVCGNPWKKATKGNSSYGTPATYTRFILPFRYHLQALNKKAKLYYQPVPVQSHDPARIQYFTSETANVLHHRATWASIPDKLWNKHLHGLNPIHFIAKNSNRTIRLEIAPPTIVLFEANNYGENNPNNILQQGILILEVHFLAKGTCLPSLDDLLEFNEYFRFTDNPFPRHAIDFHRALSEFPADFLTGEKIGECHSSRYLYIYKNRWLSLLKIPLCQDGVHCSLVSEKLIKRELNLPPDRHLDIAKDQLIEYADNRTFVWTCVVLEQGAGTLQKQFSQNNSEPWNFGHWLRLLNVDQPHRYPIKTHMELTEFEKKWLQEKTYQRWAESGTFYGYCYHSGAMLGPPLKPPDPALWYHFGQMYFDQILLLFYLRITLFAFSRELTRINQDKNINKLRKNFRLLRRSFARFTNLYQFPLISNQQQGLEMYELARKSMDIDILFDDVRNEITSTHEYLEMEASSTLASKANWLAGIGLLLAVFTIPFQTIWEKALEKNWMSAARLISWVLICVFFYRSSKTKRPLWLWGVINKFRK